LTFGATTPSSGERLKIVHMILGLGGGGAERQLALLAPALGRRGHDIHVAFVHDGVYAETLAEGGCALHRLSASRLAVIPQAISMLRRLRPALVHTWLTHMDIIGGAAARLLRVPWVMSERSAALSYPPVLINRLRIVFARHSDRIIANSEGGAEYWKINGVGAAGVEIVPNFVPLTEIDAAAALDDARIAPQDELLVHVGRLSPEKNPHLLIDALGPLFRARPRARFAFCGDGALLPELSARVQAAGHGDRVVFTGFVPNVSSWLKRASALVAVSRCEGQPNAVLEAIAAGVPVIVSDIPAHRAIVDDDAGRIVASDAAAIAGAMMDTLEHPEAAARRAALARASLATLSLDRIAERYETIYRRVIAERGAH
jgi:glycosyltransferase involved in cell wall biosynthesis